MTATALVRNEIKRFLKDPTAEVLCLTGKWGVGKTFVWKQEILAAQASNAIGLGRYAYVSLFGLNSLADVKSAIVEETADVGSIGKVLDVSSIGAPQQWKSTLLGWVSRVSTSISGIREYVMDASRILFSLLVRNQIVCIDDLERAGEGLNTKDVLGLVSFLKEERACKVVLLLNEDALEESRKVDFGSLLEKVIDTRLEFHPSPEDAAQIALPTPNSSEKQLAEYGITLGITNIRVIRKITRLVARLDIVLSDLKPAVLKQAIHSVTLFGWMIYQPNEAPKLSIFDDFDPWGILEKEKEVPPEEKAARDLLKKYKFTRIDEFDQVILDGVRSGFFDVDKLREKGRLIELQLEANQQHTAFGEAWRLYHDSFTVGADELLDAMETAFKAGIQTISPTDLSATVALFKDVGYVDRAKRLIGFFFHNRAEEPAIFFNLNKSFFGGDVKDPDVRSAFAAKLATFQVEPSPTEVLKRLAENHGWNPEDVACLARLSVDEFVQIFKSDNGPHLLGEMVRVALGFGDHSGASEKKIAATAGDALRRIAAENPLNARRVAKFGITP